MSLKEELLEFLRWLEIQTRPQGDEGWSDEGIEDTVDLYLEEGEDNGLR